MTKSRAVRLAFFCYESFCWEAEGLVSHMLRNPIAYPKTEQTYSHRAPIVSKSVPEMGAASTLTRPASVTV